MAKDLRITTLQTSLAWEDPVKNIKTLNAYLRKLKKNETDLIVLPEMFNTGFSMNAAALAEEEGGLSMQWMYEVANALKTSICGSLIIRDKKKFYNRFIWMNADGTFESYNKRHLFRMAGEDKIFTEGDESVLIEHKGWMICPQVCYDLRFPVWSRNRMTKKGKQLNYDYDVLLYVANWPAARKFAWQQLLIARAIENQSYVVGVNRIGKDGKEISYCGDTLVLDPLGAKINQTKANKVSLETVSLSMKALNDYRLRFPAFFDADKFKIL